jgi:hypothetical protein
VDSSGRAIKNTGKMRSLMGRPDGNIGRLDGARANALSPFFSHGTFGGVRMGCERSFRVLVLESLTASCLDGYESRPNACTSLALFFPFCS